VFKNKKGQVSIALIMILAILIIIATLLGVYYLQSFSSKRNLTTGQATGVVSESVNSYDDYFNNTPVPLILFKKNNFTQKILLKRVLTN